MSDTRGRDEAAPAATLVLLRHGRSTSYAEDAFSGWLDVPLSPEGEREAARAGALLAAAGLVPDVVHTSALTRATATAELVLAAAGRPAVPVHRSWRLNERHYGGLQGRTRAAVRAEVGDALFDLWRRSYEHAPPPDGESLADVRRRLEPHWRDAVAPDLRAGRTVLVVGHSNSLRALCMVLDGLDPAEVRDLDLPTGVPLRYDLDAALRPLRHGGRWLDPAAAAAGTAEVRAQGRGPAVPRPARPPLRPEGRPSEHEETA